MAYEKQIWENLPSTNTPISAERLNHMEDGIYEAWEHGGGGESLPVGSEINYTGNVSDIPDGWEQVDDVPVYSTTETVCGTWIDGKPLYRKVVNLGNLPNATNKNVSHGLTIANVNIIHFYGIAKNGNTYLNLPHCSVNNTNDSMFIDGNNILIQCVENRSAFIGYCIIEYTKTTN